MADVTTYKRSIMAYAVPASGIVVHVGDVRPAGDSIVTANPQWWVALGDADLNPGLASQAKNHQW